MPRGGRTSRAEDGRTALHTEETTKRTDDPTEGSSERISTTALVTLVGALLAAGISATALTFELFPELKPDPKTETSAALAVLGVDLNVNYSQYESRPGRRITAQVWRHHPGAVFYLQAHIEGFKRESLRLKWFTYNPGGQRRTANSAREERVFEPDAPINTQVAQIWVREPGRFVYGEWDAEDGRDYFVRFELYSDDVLLAFKDSPRFDVAG
jgi:hypothetical protein